MIEAGIKVLHDIERDMRKESLLVQKSMTFALSRTAYLHWKELQVGLKLGRLGLAAKKPLRRIKGKKRRVSAKQSARPISGLFKGMIYRKVGFKSGGGAMRVDAAQLSFEFGFLGGSKQMDWYLEKAEQHLPGYRIPLTEPELRRQKAQLGIYLRKETTYAQVPARDPVGVYYSRNREKMSADIQDIFSRKMKGERV